MSAQNTWRKLLAAATTGLLAVGALALVPATAHADVVATPTISIDKTELDPAGDTLTVDVAGFDVSATGMPGYYPCEDESYDAATATKGFYIQIGWINDNWRPSANGKSGTDRQGLKAQQGWFADDTNCIAPDRFTLAADGTASGTFTFTGVTPTLLGELPEGARYAVFTSGAGGGVQAVNEISADFTFAEGEEQPPVEPEAPATELTANVTKASKDGLTVDFAVTGAPEGETVAYGAILDKAELANSNGQDTPYIAFKMPPFVKLTDGAASFSLDAPKAKLDRTKQYVAVIWKAHSNTEPENIYAIQDITVTAAQWDAVFKTAPVEKPLPFTDVKPGDTHYAGINWMFQNGHAAAASEFKPLNVTTRGAMATMLMRINYEGKSFTPKASTVKNWPYSDVKPTDTHYKGIAWMLENGYAARADKYNPTGNVTRGAMATFLQRIADVNYTPAPGLKMSFTDVKKTDTHYKGISWLYANDHAAKVEKFNPQNSTTRGAMATFLKRIYS